MEFKVRLNKRDNLDKDLIEDMQRIAKRLNKKSITRDEYDKYGSFSSGTLERRFGTWTKVLLKAGLGINQNRNISNEQLLENIAEVWMRIGRQPTYKDFIKEVSRYSIKPYERSFGSWNKALMVFSEYINSKKIKGNEPESCTDNIVGKTQQRPRTVNYGLRFVVMQRDNFRCIVPKM